MHLFNRPALLHETAGQVIEQLRMSRRVTKLAEVTWSVDNASAKMMLPNPVDHHPGRQRVVGSSDGLGQFQPPTTFLKRGLLTGAKNCQELPRRFFAQSFRVTANINVQVLRF